MLDSDTIMRLYASVMYEDIANNRIIERNIRLGVQNMAALYAPEPLSLQKDNIQRPDFNNIAHRCAYLHKYAALHTALVQNAIQMILQQHYGLLKKLVTEKKFNLCCLGGGPGSDAIGVLAALNATFGILQINVTIVDVMKDWQSTFSSVIDHIKYGNYEIPQNNVHPDFFEWNYIGADLLGVMSNAVNQAISNASLVTMVKFISAAANLNTETMVTKIFNVMKPGALVLFIDNAAGNFRELVINVAQQCGFTTIFGPLRHFKYSDEALRADRFGYTSCYETTVTIHLLRKPLPKQQAKYRNRNIAKQQQKEQTTRNVKPLPYDNSTPHVDVILMPSVSQNVPTLSRNVNDFFRPSISQNVPTLSRNVNLNSNVNFAKVRSAQSSLPSTNHQKLNNKSRINNFNNSVRNQPKISNRSNQFAYSPRSSQYYYSPISPSASTSPISNVSPRFVPQSRPNSHRQSADDSTDNCCCCVIS